MAMKENIQEMYKEATKRLDMLHLHRDVLQNFRKRHTLYYSERGRLGKATFGILYWLSNEPEWEKTIRKIEEEQGILVYHAIHTHTSFGELLDLLYISDWPEGWEGDRGDLDHMYSYGYETNSLTWNISKGFIEFGRIGIREAGGGLIRTM